MRRNFHRRKAASDKSLLWLELYRGLKALSAYPHWMRKNIRDQIAFQCYLKGRPVPRRIGALFDKIAAGCPSFKFNPYHDELGRFTFAPGGPADDSEDDDDSNNSSTDDSDENPDEGDSPIRLVQEEVPPDLPLDEEITTTPKPPFDKLPDDPTQPPGPGYQWQGNGPPGSGQGSWTNPSTGERLYPDMDNEEHGPHWDYRAPDKTWYRWYPDGSMEPKIIAGGEIA